MQSIKLNTHVGSDGILHLDIPLGITDKEIEVMVIYQQLKPSTTQKHQKNWDGHPTFLSRLMVAVKTIQLLSTLRGILRQGKKLCEVFIRY